MLSEFAEQHDNTGCRKRDDERYSTVAMARFVSTSFHVLTYGTPSMPSSRQITFCGTSPAAQTSDVSSSVFPMKQYSASRFTSE